jgi:hypothetical protein
MREWRGRCEKVPLRCRGFRSFGRLKLVRAFEQAAEILFAGDDLCASLAGEAGHGFVFHFEPFDPHDADVFPALFPDLALTQFHGRHDTSRLGETLEISVLFRVASLLLFPMAIGINDQQGKNDQAGGKKDDNEWLIPPHIAHKTGEIGIHFRPIYTTPGER